MELLVLLVLASDNEGLFVQMGTAKKSTYGEYYLYKKGLEYGSDDPLVSVANIDGIPCLLVSGDAQSDQLVGIGIRDSSFRNLTRLEPVYITVQYFDDTTGTSTSDGRYRFTFRYDGYLDYGTKWEWLGSWDEDEDGYWDKVESGVEVYKLDSDTWKRWTVSIPTPEFSTSVGVGLDDSQLMIHNREGGPQAYSFISIVKVDQATHFVLTDDNWTAEGWGGGGNDLYESGSSPTPELDDLSFKSGKNSLRVKFYFDSAGNEWFDIGPTDVGNLNYGNGNSAPLGYGSAKVPSFNRENVVIGAWMKAGYGVSSKVKIYMKIKDAEGEIFIVGPRRITQDNTWEYVSFSLTGKIGSWWIWEDGDNPGDNEITFPIKFVGFRFDDDPDDTDSLAPGYIWIDRVQIRTDETPPYPPQLLSPADGAYFEPGDRVVFKWTITDDVYSGLNLTAPVYRIEISKDENFTSLIASHDFYQDFEKGYVEFNSTFSEETTYYWRVRSVDKMGNYGYTSARKFYITENIPKEDLSEPEVVEQENRTQLLEPSFLRRVHPDVKAFPNPVLRDLGKTVKITSRDGKVVSFKVLNIFGKVVASGSDFWDLKDSTGKVVPPGLYFIYAVVETDSGLRASAVYKLVVK